MKREKLEMKRIKAGMTKAQVADKVGITRAAYCFLENGTRSGSIETWSKVQEVLGISDSEMWGIVK